MDTEDKVMFTVLTIVGLVVGFIVLFLLSSPFIGFNLNPGRGEKVGQIVRYTEEGIVCKTFEAQLIRGGLNSGSGAFGIKPFEFTVTDPAMMQKVAQYMDSQEEVRITYDIDGIYATCNSGSGGNFLTSIEPRVK